MLFELDDTENVWEHLQRIHSESDEAYITGEFLRLHDDDGDDYAGMLDWCKRFNLINETEDGLTDLGIEFMGRNQ